MLAAAFRHRPGERLDVVRAVTGRPTLSPHASSARATLAAMTATKWIMPTASSSASGCALLDRVSELCEQPRGAIDGGDALGVELDAAIAWGPAHDADPQLRRRRRQRVGEAQRAAAVRSTDRPASDRR